MQYGGGEYLARVWHNDVSTYTNILMVHVRMYVCTMYLHVCIYMYVCVINKNVGGSK